jgi:hypothetical protein
MWDNLTANDSSPGKSSTRENHGKCQDRKYKFFLHSLFFREESIQGIFVFSPVLIHLDPESEEYLLVEDVLQDEA